MSSVETGAVTLPASFAQRRLWFLDRLRPGSPAYNVPVAVRLRGELDVAALRRALTALVARHESLRTTFREVGGEPVQVIGEPFEVPLPVREVGGEDEVRAAVAADATTAFDLERGPLLRAALLRAPDSHVLLIAAHHTVMDGWSLGVLFRDLNALYAGDGTLPGLPIQYGDFAAWQREHLGPESLAADVAYWREELAGAPELLDLPTEFPRARRSSGAGAIVTRRLPATLADDLEELSALEGATLYMTMLAAFQVLVGRYAGTTDVVVGSPIAGRSRPELEPLIGCFINTLPQRADLSGAPAFRELLAQVRARTLGAYEHQRLSFEHIVAAVRPGRTAAETPIFQVMFTVDNTPSPIPRGPLRIEPLEPYRGEVKYDLNVSVTRDGEELEIAVEYRADLFGPGWIDRFLGHYRTLLTAAALDPGRPVDELPLLPPGERRTLLEEWNDTAAEFPDDVRVHELVRRQVAATPAATALVHGDRRLTYAELYDRVGQVAGLLREHGAGPGTRVGLCLERSVELVAGLLGVLEAGAAYVPLDLEYPAERLSFMLTDAAVDIVLTHGPARASVPSDASIVLDLDTVRAGVASAVPAAREARPTDAAYVIYTSGSTGKPKGVVNNHRALVNRLVWMQRTFGLDATDAVLQKTPCSFDVSVWEFLWPLMTGARLVLAEPGGHRDPAHLAGLIRAERVTTLHFVPSMLQVFLEAADLAACRGLRRVICSGEALPAELARRFYETGTTSSLHNLYGPTEAAIDVSHWPCDPGDRGATVPIGRPIDNTRLYVLDHHREPVPIGVAGELYIGGVQVADGYVNRPELTAERFVPDPFAGPDAPWGRTLYRTGDLARWRPDGAIEFLGRLDHQIKLRGFRIELGEIEAAIRDQEEVRDVVVVARGERLVGYVVGEQERLPAAELRERLARRLPEYMVPALFVWLDRIPLSANGKADRSALPEPAGAAVRDAGSVAARDGLELELVVLWEELLGGGPIGVTDDFFSLGGDSLLVIRMLGRIAARHGRELPVSIMFSGGATIERLAGELRAARTATAPRVWSPIVPIRATGTRPPVFCLPPAVGNVLSYVDLARHLPGDLPVYGLQAAGLDPGQQAITDLDEAVTRYVAAIRDVQAHGPYRLAGYCLGSVSAFAVAQRLRAEGERIGSLTVLDGGPPNLDNGFEEAGAADIAAWFAWELGRSAGRTLEIDPAGLRDHEGAELGRAVLAAAVAADVLPPDTAEGQIERLLATFDAGVRAVRAHSLTPFAGPIVAFRACEEPLETGPLPRWEPLAGGGLVIRDVPGDHYSMMRPPHVAVLAAELDRVLAENEETEQ
ncbi:amino acid adenylation domain-containing protein [Actinomadura fulvescens]|uniref:Carrier domain-containing protein n=1 Tax=Actinomadura fulvescens TaxID=46160 RepID=A0ABP6BQ05_9ACTN